MKSLIYPYMSSFFDVCRGFFLIKELRLRLKRTFFLLLLFRIGSCIELPGIDLGNVSHNVKGILGLPAKLRLNLCGVNGIAPVVARPVRHKADQALGLPKLL